MKLIKFLILILLFVSFKTSIAQQDAEDCKDHPLFNRMPNFNIDECSQNYDAVEVPISEENTQHVEGNVTKIRYTFNEESNQKMPSIFQVEKNYENAVVSKGGKKVIIQTSPPGDLAINAVYKGSMKGKNVWVCVGEFYEPEGGGKLGAYSLWVIEQEDMKQDITANDILESLNSTGTATLHINFETGKADIKPESQKIVDEITTMLKQNPSLKLSIEGHTDNVGNATSNKTLSEKRANAILAALVSKGISKDRLSGKGWGQDKPVADNSTEEGRAKNRRVELIKM